MKEKGQDPLRVAQPWQTRDDDVRVWNVVNPAETDTKFFLAKKQTETPQMITIQTCITPMGRKQK